MHDHPVIEALLTRNSSSRLTDPAPVGADREAIFRAALRAPDHARLRPWRFLVVEGEARAWLGEVGVRVARAMNPELSELEERKQRNNPLRAPLVVVVLARIEQSPKVPEVEQLLSAGCATHAMLIAAQALGYGGVWRTGGIAYRPEMHAALGLHEDERVVGFLYLGTPDGPPKPLPSLEPGDFFSSWDGGEG